MEELATATSGMFLHMTLTSMGKVGGREGGSEVASLLPEILHTTDTLFPVKKCCFLTSILTVEIGGFLITAAFRKHWKKVATRNISGMVWQYRSFK